MNLTSTPTTGCTDASAPHAAVSRHVAGLRELVAGLDPDALAIPYAPGLWAGFDQIEKLAWAGKTLLARRVEEAEVWKQEGMPSAAEYLARRSGGTINAARDSLRTSKEIPKLSQTDAALRRGELSGAQAHLIADVATADPDAEQRPLDTATTSSLAELRQECGRVKAAADPDPEATRRRLRAQRRFRQFNDSEGAWNAQARGNPDVAGSFNAALEPIIDELFREARDEGRREPREALAFDALMEMARRAREATYGDDFDDDLDDIDLDNDDLEDDGDSRRQDEGNDDDAGVSARPDANDDADDGAAGTGFTGDNDTGSQAGSDTAARSGKDHSPNSQPRLFNKPGDDLPENRAQRRAGHRNQRKRRGKRPNPAHLAILRLDVEALHRGYVEGDELCEISGLGSISVPAARELLGESVLKLVITKGQDVLNVTHLGRGPTIAQRVALWCSQPTCSVEGCPRTFTQIDHRDDWHRVRETRLENLDRLCTFHHRLKTTQDWALVPGTGKRAFVPPDDHRHPRPRTTSNRTRATNGPGTGSPGRSPSNPSGSTVNGIRLADPTGSTSTGSPQRPDAPRKDERTPASAPAPQAA